MKYKIIDLLKKHQKTLVLGAALGVIILYTTPIDQILAQSGGGNSKNQGQEQDKVKDKDNNCENGLPPHKNGDDDNGNHLGCIGYKIVVKDK